MPAYQLAIHHRPNAKQGISARAFTHITQHDSEPIVSRFLLRPLSIQQQIFGRRVLVRNDQINMNLHAECFTPLINMVNLSQASGIESSVIYWMYVIRPHRQQVQHSSRGTVSVERWGPRAEPGPFPHAGHYSRRRLVNPRSGVKMDG